MKFAAKFKSLRVPCFLTEHGEISNGGPMTKTKSAARVHIRGRLKVLMASVMAATQCITVTPEIRGQARHPSSVDLPSLAGKSMGDIYQQFKSSRKVCKEVDKEFLARVPPDSPPYDDICEFKVGGVNLYVFTYRGRAFAFQCVFGLNAPTEPEEALLRVGINVNGAKPQIQEDPFRFYIWSGTFNEKRWKEVKVLQSKLRSRKCGMVIAFFSDKTE
jgi:hypothetical protein